MLELFVKGHKSFEDMLLADANEVNSFLTEYHAALDTWAAKSLRDVQLLGNPHHSKLGPAYTAMRSHIEAWDEACAQVGFYKDTSSVAAKARATMGNAGTQLAVAMSVEPLFNEAAADLQKQLTFYKENPIDIPTSLERQMRKLLHGKGLQPPPFPAPGTPVIPFKGVSAPGTPAPPTIALKGPPAPCTPVPTPLNGMEPAPGV